MFNSKNYIIKLQGESIAWLSKDVEKLRNEVFEIKKLLSLKNNICVENIPIVDAVKLIMNHLNIEIYIKTESYEIKTVKNEK